MDKGVTFIKTYVIVVCLLMSQLSLHAQNKEISVRGGMLYASWFEKDASILCGLTIETPDMPREERNPLQIILLVDASQHMIGAPLQHAKAAAKNIISRLSDKDMFGLITYSAYAKTLIPLQPLNPNNRRNAESAINRIKYQNSRNLSDGFKKATEQFSRFKGHRSSGHYVLLLTNGEPDKGVTDKKQLTGLAEEMHKNSSVKISTFGYDQHYDESFLISFSSRTGGRAYFIEEDNIATIGTTIGDEVEKILNIATCNVVLTIEPPTGSTISYLQGATLKDNTIYVGDLQANKVKPIVFSLKGRPERSRDMVVNFEYQEPIRLTSRKDRIYIDVPLSSGSREYDRGFAPLLLEFSILNNVVAATKKISAGEKGYRRKYAEKFKETVKWLEQTNNVIRSDYLKDVVEDFYQLQRDIENTAILDPIYVKRVKYKLLQLLYER